jgi:formate dehydrogenase maturation protein FdhE
VDESGFERLAASLRADAGDIGTFVEVLADKLSLAVPALVKVERERTFARRTKRVRRISIEFPEERYELAATGSAPACSRSTIVRGIALRTEPLALDAWIEQLARALAHEAERTDAGRAALERLLL